MIRFLFCFLLVFYSVFSYSQNVRIYGNVVDYGDYSTVILSPSVASKLLDSKIETNPKKGYFEFNIIVSNACFYKLYYKSKKITIFVKPGTNSQLVIDNTKATNYVNFYEDFVQENTLLNLESTPYLGNKQDREIFKQAAQQGVETYFNAIDKAADSKQKEWDAQISEVNLSQEFVELYPKNYIEMASYLYKYYYPKYLGYQQDSFVALQDKFIDLYKNFVYHQDFYQCPLFYDNYLNIIKSKVNARVKEKVVTKSTDDLEMYKSYLKEAETAKDPYVRELLIENLIGEWVSSYGRTSDLKEEIVQYINQVVDNEKKNSLKKRLVNLAQYETGQPAPNFSFEDYSGNKRHSRELVGKIVYIHVWASSNQASMNEWKAAKDIYAKYKDRSDLVFLFLSIDDDKDAWEKTIREQKLFEEIQAISFPHGFNSDFARKYAIQSLPSYILIDKSGNIISNKVPRPSQPERLIPFLNKLLGI
jgi:hypothetical protein